MTETEDGYDRPVLVAEGIFNLIFNVADDSIKELQAQLEQGIEFKNEQLKEFITNGLENMTLSEFIKNAQKEEEVEEQEVEDSTNDEDSYIGYQ